MISPLIKQDEDGDMSLRLADSNTYVSIGTSDVVYQEGGVRLYLIHGNGTTSAYMTREEAVAIAEALRRAADEVTA